MEVAGVDGCPSGWLLVVATTEPLRVSSVRVVADFSRVLEQTQHRGAVGIDIPIGLSESDRRKPDVEARRVLRPLRSSSVFPSPLRQLLLATSYREACDISQRFHVEQKKISKQTFALMPKIKEVDDLMTPQLQDRVCEVHPEICFWALNGHQPVEDAKRSPAGEQQRRELVASVFANDPGDFDIPVGAALDDLFDACAAAWTASRIASGAAKRLPDDPDVDGRGLRMEIVY